MTHNFGYKLLKINDSARHEANSFQHLVVYTIFSKSFQCLSLLIFIYIPTRRLAKAGLDQNLVQIAIRSVKKERVEQRP
jgi:hypothetical protein